MWKRRLLALLNRGLAAADVELTARGRTRWWRVPATFTFRGRTWPYFRHATNCGWPPHVTERTVELALADAWLTEVGEAGVLEIGAVTPYYWPGRVARVLDPFDEHPRVSDRRSVLDLDLSGETVLSISTLEHVGTGEYGTATASSPIAALEKVLTEASRALVTLPLGTDAALDAWLLERSPPEGVALGFLARGPHGEWTEVGPRGARRPYGDPDLKRRHPGTRIGHWANAVAVLRRDIPAAQPVD